MLLLFWRSFVETVKSEKISGSPKSSNCQNVLQSGTSGKVGGSAVIQGGRKRSVKKQLAPSENLVVFAVMKSGSVFKHLEVIATGYKVWQGT